jgi:lysophospholipase L1-like esterase
MKARGRQVPALDLDVVIPGEPPIRRMAVLGDSSAAGHGLPDAEQAVARQVARGLVDRDGRATELVTAARDGADIRCVIDEQLTAASNAEVVLIGVGANDAIRRHGPVRVGREMTELLDAVRTVALPGAAVVLVTAPDLSVVPALPPILRGPLGWWCRMTARVQADTAVDAGVSVVSLPAHLLGPEVFGTDGFHPGTVGHGRTAAVILERLTARSVTVAG